MMSWKGFLGRVAVLDFFVKIAENFQIVWTTIHEKMSRFDNRFKRVRQENKKSAAAKMSPAVSRI
jgi:hypothetical protein